MAEPKPITLIRTPEENYTGVYAPEPFNVIGEFPPLGVEEIQLTLEALPGFDIAETQTLKNVSGVVSWVTDTP